MPAYSQYVLPVLTPFLLSLIITPLFIVSALKNGFTDKPGLHKTDHRNIPLFGGMAIFISIIFTLFIYMPLSNKLITMVIAALVIVITGLLDDIYNLKPLAKLSGQILGAAIMVLFNLSNLAPLIKLFGRFYFPGFVTIIGMICFIVLIINAINLIDGLDGLSAGVAALLFLGMALTTFIYGSSNNILLLQLIGFGACIGFLPYNFYPARIFLGDTGSMLLGFLLSATFLFSISAENFSGSLVLGAVYIFAFPLLDVAFAIYRRARGNYSIFKADRCHIHHLFVGYGYSVRKTTLIIYLINAFFIFFGLTLIYLDLGVVLVMLISLLTFVATVLLIRKFAKMGIDQGKLSLEINSSVSPLFNKPK